MTIVNRLMIATASLVCVFALHYSARAAGPIQPEDERISLEGDWKVQFGDNKRYASSEYDDSGWHTVAMPGSLTRYILGGNMGSTTLEGLGKIYGICWLRKSVFIGKETKKESLGLILGRIGNADETFFNGVRIGGKGKFPPDEFSMWNHPRHYLIPKSLIRFGEENVISVRISYYVYCEMVGTLAIADFEDWSFDASLQSFTRVTMNYVIIFMGVPLVLMFMLFFIRKRDQEYLFYCLQLVCGLFIVLDTCDYFFWDAFGNTLLRLKVLGLSWVALNVAHPIFLHRIYGLRRKRIEIALWAFLGFIIILLATITGKTSDRYQAMALIALTTPIGFYNLSCHVSALVKKSPDAKLFAVFGCTVILGAIHDGFAYFPKFGGFTVNLFGYTPENFIFGYSAAALYIGTALLLIQRLIKTMNNLDEMNVNLEKKVRERTEQLTGANEELRQAMEEVETINEEVVQVNRELKIAESRHERDVAMAVNMQSAFLPDRVPASEKYDIAFVYKPMAGISGDFYDFYTSEGDIEGVGIFDVSGHGIASGLITLMAKSIVYGNFVHMKDEKLNRVFESINRKLIREFGHIDNYLTGILIRFDNDHMEYVNSGHPDLIYRSSRAGRVGRVLDRDGNSISGPFMGTRDMEQPYKSLTIKISRGDCLLLYTDCLLESGDADGNLYDELKIMESLKNAPSAGAQEILDFILEDFYAFTGRRDNFRDDLTAILIRRK